MPNNTFDHLIKAIVIGQSGVGKTSLQLRYCEDTFGINYCCTIGVDLRIKEVIIEGKKLKLQIWDTAEVERFRTISRAYYRGASAIAVVFDITDANSFKDVDNWLMEIGKYADPDVCKILLGNKIDLANMRAVSYEEAYSKAKSNDMAYFEVSAKTGENVVNGFECLWSAVLHSPILMKKKEEKKKGLPKVLYPSMLYKLKQYCN